MYVENGVAADILTNVHIRCLLFYGLIFYSFGGGQENQVSHDRSKYIRFVLQIFHNYILIDRTPLILAALRWTQHIWTDTLSSRLFAPLFVCKTSGE